ncbi:predicted protein [Nematostella vectensis]|uniref:F-box domain-containing protein n=1 Tax=Nematostella vectensis TaxID=45351 RepID=A7SAI5_NEMVE|nr:predicted protein [Nematostella vectensis]|eukprot:XP_001631378.1 predicted protein [Nematostella vectensis]
MASILTGKPQSEYILSLAEILELVLSFLPARDLANSSQVCRLWRDTVSRIFRLRKAKWTSYLVHHGPNTPCSSKLSMDLMIAQIVDYLDNLRIFPAAAIVFISRSAEFCEPRRDEVRTLITALKSRLPKSCNVIGCVGYGVIGCQENAPPEELEMAEAVSVLLMPRVQGVSTHLFNMSCTDVRNNRSFKSRWEKSLNIPAEKQLKFALLFAKGDIFNLDIIGKVASGIWQINSCEDGEKSNVVIIGGLVDSLLFVDHELKNTGVIGLGIAGPNVHAVSVVHHGETQSGVTKSLKQLNGFGIPCTDSSGVCFMVSCVGRGEKFYMAKNVESQIFKQVFPYIPVGGFFGNEIFLALPEEHSGQVFIMILS